MNLIAWAQENDCKIGWGNFQYLDKSLAELLEISKANVLSELQNNRLNHWNTYSDYKLEKKNTLIILAHSVRGKSQRLILDFAGKKASFLLPPAYADGGANIAREAALEKSLANYLAGYGHQIERLEGPYKNLASKIGLGKYGRNNLIYVDGYGSYIRMIGFVTDAQVSPDVYPGVSGNRVLETCGQCNLCKANCPTSAIGDDRFLLHVDQCLAYYHTRPSKWPDFVESAEHESLVGCISCQNACPINEAFSKPETTLNQYFDEAESNYILGDSEDTDEKVTGRINDKLADVGLGSYQEYIIRNIRAGARFDSK